CRVGAIELGPNFDRVHLDGSGTTTVAAAQLKWARSIVGGANFWRVGARWYVTPSTTVDLSPARGLNGNAPAWWTLGLTRMFDR
ncbi:MAG: hypothetical protein ABUU24_04795, partial [Variovorax sp.]